MASSAAAGVAANLDPEIGVMTAERVNSTLRGAGPMTARILLTEDDEDVRELIELVLVDVGYKVDATNSVAGALSLLEHGSYDPLFTDGLLPDGTGLTLAGKAKQRYIKVVIFTGLAEAFPNEGLAQYTVLRKPVDMDNVVQTVAQVIAD